MLSRPADIYYVFLVLDVTKATQLMLALAQCSPIRNMDIEPSDRASQLGYDAVHLFVTP